MNAPSDEFLYGLVAGLSVGVFVLLAVLILLAREIRRRRGRT